MIWEYEVLVRCRSVLSVVYFYSFIINPVCLCYWLDNGHVLSQGYELGTMLTASFMRVFITNSVLDKYCFMTICYERALALKGLWHSCCEQCLAKGHPSKRAMWPKTTFLRTDKYPWMLLNYSIENLPLSLGWETFRLLCTLFLQIVVMACMEFEMGKVSNVEHEVCLGVTMEEEERAFPLGFTKN